MMLATMDSFVVIWEPLRVALIMKAAYLVPKSVPAKRREGRFSSTRAGKAAAELGISSESARTFAAISDPKNASKFSIDAAIKAFAHVKTVA